MLLYTSINAHIFSTDELKIRFTLSFLTEKEAAQWHKSWVRKNQAASVIVYPTWAVFVTELRKAFELIDQVGEAMHKIEALRQGTKTAEEVNTEWDLLVGQAGIDGAGDTTLIKMYQKFLN